MGKLCSNLCKKNFSPVVRNTYTQEPVDSEKVAAAANEPSEETSIEDTISPSEIFHV
jgi:hypothetical protein